eukprot:5144071-Pyramimonas_sp.AAC.1
MPDAKSSWNSRHKDPAADVVGARVPVPGSPVRTAAPAVVKWQGGCHGPVGTPHAGHLPQKPNFRAALPINNPFATLKPPSLLMST